VTPSKPQGNSAPGQAPNPAAVATAAAAAAAATPRPVSSASSSSSDSSSSSSSSSRSDSGPAAAAAICLPVSSVSTSSSGSSSSSSSRSGSRPDKPKPRSKTKQQLELLRTTYDHVCAAAGGQRVTLSDWQQRIGGDWKLDDFLAKLNQDGPKLTKADISKWIVAKPTRKTATVVDQRQISIDRSRFMNTPTVMKALGHDPTPAEVAAYKAADGVKTMTEGEFLQQFAKSVSKSVNTLTNFRICARQWSDSTPTHRPGSKNSSRACPMQMYSFSFVAQGCRRRPKSSWKLVMFAD
jgi:hypothetical protein